MLTIIPLRARSARSSPRTLLSEVWVVWTCLSALVSCVPVTHSTHPLDGPASQHQDIALQLPANLVWPEGAVVRIVGETVCTGTLIAENLVVTAHTCVSRHNEDGSPKLGDVPATSLTIEIGADDLPFAEVDVRAVVSPARASVAGDDDLAILVLTKKLVGIPTFQARLSEPPPFDEGLDRLGYGRCEPWHQTISLHQSRGRLSPIPIWTSRLSWLGAEPICPGDQGGPVVRKGVPYELFAVISAQTGQVDGGAIAGVRGWPELLERARAVATKIDSTSDP